MFDVIILTDYRYVNPEKTDFFYFVADGSGGHAFSKTLKEHNINVAKWRKIEKNKKQFNFLNFV